jgi:hypothetical protein
MKNEKNTDFRKTLMDYRFVAGRSEILNQIFALAKRRGLPAVGNHARGLFTSA